MLLDATGPMAMTGVQALGRLLLDQRRADADRGWRTAGLVSGYRGSPLGGLDLLLQREAATFAAHGVEFIPGVNEELGATVVYGSQLATQLPGKRVDGVFGLWYGKAPGVDRSADAIKHGTWMGTTERGGVLAVAGDDPASKSSSLPSASGPALAEMYLPVLAPADVADVLRLGRIGFEMSRFTGAWTGFTVVTDVADGYESVELGVPVPVSAPGFEWDGRPWRPSRHPGVDIPRARAMEREVLEGRLAAAVAFGAANGVDQVSGPAGARLGFVAAGHDFGCLLEALDRLGLTAPELDRRGIRLLRLGMVHPLDPAGLARFAAGLDELVVVEAKRPFVETQVKEALYGLAVRPAVFGKHGPDGPLIPVDGVLDADRLRVALGPFLASRVGVEHVDLPRPERLSLPLVARTPFFCSGCPHNRSTVVPEGSIAGAGIGCHTMTTFMDRSAGFTQMGGEGASWVGAAPFTETEHLFQNMGDGTYFHSGGLAIRQAVAAGTTVTFKLLHNSAVAMTGGQRADGAVAPPGIAAMLHAEGVTRTVVVTDDPSRFPRRTPWPPGVRVRHRNDLDEVQRELREVPGVTVILYDQECAAEQRRTRKRTGKRLPVVQINPRVCEGCGDCARKSNCLSVEPFETEFGRKTRIDQPSCNNDLSCLEGDCPSFVTLPPTPTATPTFDDPGDLPEPVRPARANIVMVGIGGTGVVTTNQVLATAAVLDGLPVRALDQTGLSQKAGAVVSHLRVATGRTGQVPAAQADAYLVFDTLAAAAEPVLSRCSQKTTAVASTTRTPTGQMITNPDTPHPEDLPETLRSRTGSLHTFDAKALSQTLFADTAPANFLVVGAAYQLGLLPQSSTAIEAAITRNGVGVEKTLQAFRAGRKKIVDPTWPPQPQTTPPPPHPLATPHTGELRRLLDIRIPDLIAYQNETHAHRYLAVVNATHQAEEATNLPGHLTEAVATNLHKLMTYKDEYEVARLHLEAAYPKGTTHRLHPPILRALGFAPLTLKRTARPLFKLLKALRPLRRTPLLDLFAHTRLRRSERTLIQEYVTTITTLLPHLTEATYEQTLELATLPTTIRGYESIKLAAIAAYHTRRADLLAQLDAFPERTVDVTRRNG